MGDPSTDFVVDVASAGATAVYYRAMSPSGVNVRRAAADGWPREGGDAGATWLSGHVAACDRSDTDTCGTLLGGAPVSMIGTYPMEDMPKNHPGKMRLAPLGLFDPAHHYFLQ